METNYFIFVSHATRPDADERVLTEALVSRLRQAGLSVYLDLDCMNSRATILPTIDTAIENSSAAILVISKRAESSGWVTDERIRLRERQHAGGYPFIALRFDNLPLPPGFSWLRVFEVTPDSHIPELATKILSVLGEEKSHS